MKRIISFWAMMVLAIIFLVSCGGGGGGEESSESVQKEETIDDTPVFPDGWDDDKVPILGWCGIPNGLARDDVYEGYKDAGFSINLDVLVYDEAGMSQTLDMGEKYDVKIVSRGFGDDVYLDEDKVKETVEKYKDEPAFYGYALLDEPADDEAIFEKLGKIGNNFKKYDPDRICYVNLLPSYCVRGDGKYEAYCTKLLENVPVDMLSFDNYPIKYKDYPNENEIEIRDTWFENLEIIRKVALKYNKPIWAFILSTRCSNYTPCELQYMRIQAYADLAYGAKCLQYFTYYKVADDMYDAPIDENGNKTAQYAKVKQLNEEIQNRARVFVNADVVNVYHLSTESLPIGVTRCPEKVDSFYETISYNGADVTVSLMQDGSTRYLMAVNTGLTVGRFGVKFSSKVKEILTDGSEVERTSNRSETLQPGQAVIYKINNL